MPTRLADPDLATPADHAACRALIRQGSKSFFAASLLLPAAVREPALALYAFCRLADDLVDDGRDTDPLTRLRARLAGVYEGRPTSVATDRAFADVVCRYAIPRVLPEALLEGFQWDLEGRRYENASQLNAYAARVAGSVGAMMACLMQARAPHLVARACDLGVAMQLTNIARDVGEDARAGRLYLPRSWMHEEHIDPDSWLRRPVFSPNLAKVVARLLLTADELYERASLGITSLPRDCRRGIYAARFLYAEIGHELRRHELDSVSRRTVVPLTRKATLLARALRATEAASPEAAPAVLEEARFLIDAVVAEPPGAANLVGAPANLEDRVEWLVNLFERLERRDRLTAHALPERTN
jgi:15-cis-phytoene synthase